MSEKKVFKQMQLPFQLITSPKTPTTSAIDQKSVEKSSPKTPKTSKSKPSRSSRKRKQSSEGDNVRSIKVGRLTTSTAKENIAEPEVLIELSDSDGGDQSNSGEKNTSKKLNASAETTPTTSTESVVHIKLPSRSKRKQPVVQKSSLEEEDPDDSIVYLDNEELPFKSSKKSVKKSEKKRKAAAKKSSAEGVKRVKKTLLLNEQDIHEENESDSEVIKIIDEEKVPSEAEIVEKTADKGSDDTNKMEIEHDDEPVISDQISKLMNASGALSSSPVKNIQEILSDDENQTTVEHDTSLNKSVDQGSNAALKILTPKAQARRDEFERRRIEKELQKKKERDEREFQRLKEKEQREEAKRKEKEEKDEQRKREKDEREKKRLAEIEKKEEEKRQKEDERKRLIEQKEEERRQKEDERKRQNEARDEEKRKKDAEKQKEEERKKKTAQAITKFFVPVKKKEFIPMQDDEASKESTESAEPSTGNFMPFQIHGKMRLAPCVRYNLSMSEIERLDAVMRGNAKENETYLMQLKNGKRNPKSSEKTWPLEEKPDDDDDNYSDVMIVDDELQGFGEDIKEDDNAHLKTKHRAKFLMFCENRRPAFYGTWRKKSGKVYARRPFSQDEKFFDYENDSDDEWEEEEPGESLHGSDSEKEKEAAEEDYEVDNDFFVPHGHLSDDELNPDGEDEVEDNSPETQKAKLKILQQEFAAEMKKKTEKIKPRLIGCFWMNGDEDEEGATMKNDSEKKYHCSTIVWKILKAREMWCSGEEIKMEDFEPEVPDIEEEPSEKPVQQRTPAQQKVRPKIDNDVSTKELIRLTHGNTNSKKYIIKEFQAHRLKNLHMKPDFQEFSIRSVDEKMMEVADYKSCPDDGPLFGKKCWYVKPDVVRQYFGDEKLPLPNQWIYILEKEVKEKKPKQMGDNGEQGNSKKKNFDDEVIEIID